jgi:G3E family GTPase
VSERVGVLLVGGFLGAGKTTLVRHLMADPALGPRMAVLVNELGALGLDGQLLAQAHDSAALRTVQLDSGCLCCTLRGELGEALVELARPRDRPPPAQIVVELSGAALASEVHFQVATQALSAPYYADGLVCVVDALAAPRWAREAEGLFVDQLARADLVLLSKTDLAPPDARHETEALIARLAPSARVVVATRGDIEPSLLLGAGTAAPVPHAGAAAQHLIGETVVLERPIEASRLLALLEALTPSLFRIKGLVDVVEHTGEPATATVVQCVGDQIELTPTLGATGPRRLIFIGPAFDRARVRALVADATCA